MTIEIAVEFPSEGATLRAAPGNQSLGAVPGYVDALTFLESRSEVDPARRGIWGDSYTAAQVVLVSACNPRLRAVIAQCPTFGAVVPDAEPDIEQFDAIRGILADGDVQGTPETTIGPLPVVSFDQASVPSLLQPIQASAGSSTTVGGRAPAGGTASPARCRQPRPVQPVPCARPSSMRRCC